MYASLPFLSHRRDELTDLRQLGRSLAAWYDVQDRGSMVIDGSNRVQLIADKSGNSLVNCLCLNGSSGNYASSPNAAPLQITGDIDMQVLVSLADWTPTANQILFSKDDGNAQRSWIFRVNTAGTLSLFLSADGSNTAAATSSVAVPVSDYGLIWVRATWRQSDGRVQFFTSSDGSSWTQLGADQSRGIASIFNSTSPIQIGARSTGGITEPATGNFRRARLYNGINGTLVFDANFATFSKLASTGTESSSNAATVTINTSGDLGARICGERDLVQMTASKQPVYLPWAGDNYLYLNAVAGNGPSTPDSAATSVTGSVDVRCLAYSSNWATASGTLVSKWTDTGNQKSYILRFGAAGKLAAYLSQDGSTAVFPTERDHGLTGAGWYWVRFTFNAATGDVIYYTSVDGVAWTPLTTSTTALTGLYDGSAAVWVGSYNAGASALFSGNVSRAQIYNGIAGTLVADFDPSRYVSGTTFVASTGETWTLNGGATIVTQTCIYGDGSDDYMKAAPFSLSQPGTRYFVGSQVSWTINEGIMDGDAAATRWALYQQGTTPNLQAYAGAGVNNSGLAVQNRGVVTEVYNGANSSLRVNRSAAATGNAGTQAANGTILFARYDVGAFSNATLSELALFSEAHLDWQQNRVITYAGRKHRIAV